MECGGRGVCPHRGRYPPDAALAAKVEGGASAVGVAVILAQVLVQAAEKIFAQKMIADERREVSRIAPVDPVPAHVDHALHGTRLVYQVNDPLLWFDLLNGSRPGAGVVCLPARERLLEQAHQRVGIDVAGDDQGASFRPETVLRGSAARRRVSDS